MDGNEAVAGSANPKGCRNAPDGVEHEHEERSQKAEFQAQVAGMGLERKDPEQLDEGGAEAQ